MDHVPNPDDHDLLKLLETLKQASKDLQNNPIFSSNNSQATTIKSFLELETKAHSLLSTKPNLFKLSQLLSNLKSLLKKLENFQGYGLKSLLGHHLTSFKISQIAYSIEAEVQAYIDRERIQNLVRVLAESSNEKEEEKVKLLTDFIKRVSQGFDRDFQDLILKAKVFSTLEMLLCNRTCSKKVREHAALAIAALASFNKNVFVGLVLMGSTIQDLISMDSSTCIQVLCSLINLIRSPLIDEIHSRGEISKIISLLSSDDQSIQVAAMDCICQIAYFGRREVIETMLEEGLINRLVEMQRSNHGNNLIQKDQCIGNDTEVINCEENSKSESIMESEDECKEDNCPFANCVARFAVQVEVGEGLSIKEKKEIKLEILRRVREASISEAQSATIVAEVLWGSSPCN